jgi:HD-like signal output (HDOD) protein
VKLLTLRAILTTVVMLAFILGAVFLARTVRRTEEAAALDDATSDAPPSPEEEAAKSARARAARRAQPTTSAHAETAAEESARLDALRKLQVVRFGSAIPPAPVTQPPHAEIITAVRLTLAEIADKPNYVPRRPMLLPKLVRAMNDDSISRRELGQIIASDPALTGNLLRLANSPFYRIQSDPIESLDRAIAVLGLEGMRSLISAALLQPVFRITGGLFVHFGEITWEHSLRASSAAEAHAAIVENSDPFAAQLLSLMLGLGTMVVFRVALDGYQTRDEAPHVGVLSMLIDTESAPVARRVGATWSLSERIDAALADQAALPTAHHSSLGRSLQFGRFMGALAVLRARNVISAEAVTAALKSGGSQGPTYERIWARLNPVPDTPQ